MKFEDFYQFPKGHPPSPYDLEPLMENESGEMVHISFKEPVNLVAIGWIDDSSFSTGKIARERLEMIRMIAKSQSVSDGHLGVHSCCLCGKTSHSNGKIHAHGHYLYAIESDVIMFPRFIIHYIVSHDYLPPERLFEAIDKGRRMTIEDFNHSTRLEFFEQWNEAKNQERTRRRSQADTLLRRDSAD